MKSEFLLAFNEICSDRGLPREVVLEAIETALVSAYRRNVDSKAPGNVMAKIDPTTGEARIFVEKQVVEKVADPYQEVGLAKGRAIQSDVQVGDVLVVEDTPADFGRIAAQTAKQVILQRIREAERDAQYVRYAEQEGEIVHGIVQSIKPKVVMLNLGNVEAILPRSQQMAGERYHLHQRLRAYVLEVRNTSQGPKIVLSRSHPKMLRRLLELEVPEIFNGTVEIRAIAREAGSRSKIAVAARQPGVDPVGACVGMRGVRIKSIVNELGGEKIDVIEWSPNAATFIAKALSPARVLSVRVDEESNGRKFASVVVPDDQLSLAIGRAGQNARLAAKLSDYRIDIQGATEAATWALQRVNEDPDVLPNLGLVAELLPAVAGILQRHQENLPYSGEELLAVRQVVEAVWEYYASVRRAERESRIMEEMAQQAAIEMARERIPAQAFEISLADIGLSVRVQNCLERAGLTTAGDVLERLAVEGDEGLLMLPGIGPKTFSEIKQCIEALALPEAEEPIAAEAIVEEKVEAETALPSELPLKAPEEATVAVEKESVAEAEVEVAAEVEPEIEEPEALELPEEAIVAEESPDDLEIPSFLFEERDDEIDREEKLRRERERRRQLVYDEETGELVARRRRKRGTEETDDWRHYSDY